MDSESKCNDNRLSVTDCLEILKNSARYKSPDLIPLEALRELDNRLRRNQESKKLAREAAGCDILLQVLVAFDIDSKVLCYALKTMVRLVDQQNRQLNDREIACQMGLLLKFEGLIEEEGDRKLGDFSTCLRLLIRWMKISSIKNETNRRSIFNVGLTKPMKIILKSEKITGREFRDLCSLFRALLLDDDPDFECGNGIFRARRIAGDILSVLVSSMKKFKYEEDEKKTACEIFKTVTALLVENKFSKLINDSGGIESIIEIMGRFRDDEELYRLGLKLIKILANHSEAGIRLIENEVAPLVLSALSRIQTGSLAVSGLGCVAALALVNPRSSELFYDLEVARSTIETMKRYPGSPDVQRQGARIVSRILEARSCREKIDARTFLDLGFESVLEIAMRLDDVEENIDDDLRAAFHHLGLESELKHRWTKTPAGLRVKSSRDEPRRKKEENPRLV